MVQRQAGRHEFPPEHHIARHCRPRDFGATGLLLDSAFELRPGEEYLSTNWLEFFTIRIGCFKSSVSAKRLLIRVFG